MHCLIYIDLAIRCAKFGVVQYSRHLCLIGLGSSYSVPVGICAVVYIYMHPC